MVGGVTMAEGSGGPRSGALFIEGTHMSLALEGAGNPPMKYIVRAIEALYGCKFVRKEWHQATQDGRPSPFHLEISAPENGHVTPKIRPMKLQTGRAVGPDGQLLPQWTTIRVEKGVDVALGLAMVQRSFKFDDYDLVVVVTGDGDLEEAFESSTRRMYVCGLREGLATSLRPWVRSEGDRGLYLEDVLAKAWVLTGRGAQRSPELVGQADPPLSRPCTSSSSSSSIPSASSLVHHHHQHPSNLVIGVVEAKSSIPTLKVNHMVVGSSSSAAVAPPSIPSMRRTSSSFIGIGGGTTTSTATTTTSTATVTSTPGTWVAALMDGGGEREGEKERSLRGATGGTTSNTGSGNRGSLDEKNRLATAPSSSMVIQRPIGGSTAGTNLVNGSSSSSGSSSSNSSSNNSSEKDLRAITNGLKSKVIVGGTKVITPKAGKAISSAHSSPSASPAPTTPTGSGERQRKASITDEESGGSVGGGSGSEKSALSKRRKTTKLRLKCFAGPLCTKLKDDEHLRRTTHPCQAGAGCTVLKGPETSEKTQHMERFLHPCPRGSICEDQTLDHTALFEHTEHGLILLCVKKGCKGGDRADHQTPHRHVCPHGRNCSFLAHSVADKRVIRHTAAFLHPCPWGLRCVAARAPEWNWEHMRAFTHSEPVKGNGRDKSDEEDDLDLLAGEPREGHGHLGDDTGYIPLSNAEEADEEEEEEEEGEEEEEEEEQVGEEEDDGHDLLVGAMSVPSVSMVDGEEDVVDDFVVSYNALPQKDYLNIFRPSQAELGTILGGSRRPF